jgi:hypothetical protein
MEDKNVIAHLASGAVLLFDEMGGDLVTRHGHVTSDQVTRLGREGWIDWFANSGGARLSDAGRLAYIKSTDEMGDGKLLPPVTPNV